MERVSGPKEIATALLEIRNAVILAGLVGHKLSSNAEVELYKLAVKYKLVKALQLGNEE